LSKLTKILIVLLAVSSIVLSAIVVVYVANSDNYRQKSDTLRTQFNAAFEKEKEAKRELDDRKKKYQQQEDALNSKMASLQAECKQIETKLKESEREKAVLLQKVDSWTSITKDFYTTNDKQGQLLKNTLEELKKAQAEKIKTTKELNETTNSLIEKMAIIETLEAEKRRLIEAKAELQSQVDKYLQPIGRRVEAPVPVTRERTRVLPVMPRTKAIGLKGLVKEVDLKNSLARISLGAADGVKDSMKFHVTRGDEFICDILIIDVDAEDSVGILELVQQAPRANDSVSTNF
jgi:hypothetical protein